MVEMYKKITALRESKGISEAQMCREAGISGNTMTELKSGRVKSLSSKKLNKLSIYFGVPVDVFVGENRDVDPLQALKDDERALLHSYRTMTEEHKRMMQVFANGLKND